MIIDKVTIEFVNRLLNLPAKGDEQDWFVELADRNRVNEFVQVLLAKPLSDNEKYAILSLSLASYDDFLSYEDDNGKTIWKDLITILDRDKGKYGDLLNYWALLDEKDISNCFRITPLVRNYLQDNTVDNVIE